METKETDREKALRFIEARVGQWGEQLDGEQGGDPHDHVLSIDHHVVSRVWLTFGGPTAFIDYNHRTGSAELHSTYGDEPVTVELTAGETEVMVEALGLEDRAEMAEESGGLLG